MCCKGESKFSSFTLNGHSTAEILSYALSLCLYLMYNYGFLIAFLYHLFFNSTYFL